MVTTMAVLLPLPPPPPPLSTSFCSRQRSITTVAFRCSSTNPDTKTSDFNGSKSTTTPTPPLLKFAVTGVTELLRLFSNRRSKLREEIFEEKVVARCTDDVIAVLRSDYANAYFLTGKFTSDIYTEECLFEDPTIKFRDNLGVVVSCSNNLKDIINEKSKSETKLMKGIHTGLPKHGKMQYSKNLELIVPFLDDPSLELKAIEKGENHDTEYILATWKLRTYLKLPWRPLISIEGTTAYNLNSKFEIFRHSESWEISALEAVGQIFTPRKK